MGRKGKFDLVITNAQTSEGKHVVVSAMSCGKWGSYGRNRVGDPLACVLWGGCCCGCCCGCCFVPTHTLCRGFLAHAPPDRVAPVLFFFLFDLACAAL